MTVARDYQPSATSIHSHTEATANTGRQLCRCRRLDLMVGGMAYVGQAICTTGGTCLRARPGSPRPSRQQKDAQRSLHPNYSVGGGRPERAGWLVDAHHRSFYKCAGALQSSVKMDGWRDVASKAGRDCSLILLGYALRGILETWRFSKGRGVWQRPGGVRLTGF